MIVFQEALSYIIRLILKISYSEIHVSHTIKKFLSFMIENYMCIYNPNTVAFYLHGEKGERIPKQSSSLFLLGSKKMKRYKLSLSWEVHQTDKNDNLATYQIFASLGLQKGIFSNKIPPLLFFFLFFCFYGHICGTGKFLDQGQNLSYMQLPAFATATAMLVPSCICDLFCSWQQSQILNPLSKAKDITCILTNTMLSS